MLTQLAWRVFWWRKRHGNSGRFEGVADRRLRGPSETLLLYILCSISIEDNIGNVIALHAMRFCLAYDHYGYKKYY
jgi:hypothetical protein